MIHYNDSTWEVTILDANVKSHDLQCFNIADIDNDGLPELISGGSDLVWHSPHTHESGVIAANRHFHVGMGSGDIDSDGVIEICVGESDPGPEKWELVMYKPDRDADNGWERIVIDPAMEGGPHDILFRDIDGDGVEEILAIACYTSTPGIYAYKMHEDVRSAWKKHKLYEGVMTEGLAVGDLDGDGTVEIICGPDWYKAPAVGAFSGKWTRHTFAPNFREMCRTALVDITGNGRPDIVITDSEYMDGYLSWFENRIGADLTKPWPEHRLENDVVYSHSLDAARDSKGVVTVITGEMHKGGWDAPQNYHCRVICYVSRDDGLNWERTVVSKGEGTHNCLLYDIDGDGELEAVGKSDGAKWGNPKFMMWKKPVKISKLSNMKHMFIDRDKPRTCVDILAADVNGDGKNDIVCGKWWYRNPDWKRFDIPGVVEIINAYDIDGDDRKELFGIVAPACVNEREGYGNLNSHVCWLKPTDPENGVWEQYYIGAGNGDWPHGSLVAPLLPGGKLALILGYHDARLGKKPEIFEMPAEPTKGPWLKRELADINYGEEFIACDVDGDGKLDIVAGPYWLENAGDGTFIPYKFAEDITFAARIAVTDVNKDGRPDVVIGEEIMDFDKREIPFSNIWWYENPEDPRKVPWKGHVIDSVRCAHSIGYGDIDGDGEDEIIAGEHDPFWPYRKQCRIMAYKKADPAGLTWKAFQIDGRFEHHDGTKVVELKPGKKCVISHGWTDNIYVHVWEVND